jgi:hypothetical protein
MAETNFEGQEPSDSPVRWGNNHATKTLIEESVNEFGHPKTSRTQNVIPKGV